MTAAPLSATASPGQGPERLLGVVRGLAEPRSRIESAFVEMGGQLVGCIGLINEVEQAYAAMPAEFEGESFLDAVCRMEFLRAQVDEIAAAGFARNEAIEALAKVARTVPAPLHALKRSVRGLMVTAVNARIAAAGLPAGAEDFDVFTQEMVTLTRQIERAVSIFAESFRDFLACFEAARHATAEFDLRHGRTPARIALRVEEQLRSIDTHRSRARERVTAYQQASAGIARQVSAAVSALQVGDITRQRLEHGEAALHDLALEASSEAPVTNVVCHLQAAQVRSAAQQLDGELDRLATALRDLTDDAETVVMSGRRDAESLLSAGKTALAGIVAELQDSRTLLGEFELTRARLGDIGRDLAGAAAEMLTRLQAVVEIEHDIRLLSLNAAIRSNRMGEDAGGLRVISENLRLVAAEAVAAASDMVAGLGGAGEAAGTLAAASVASHEPADRAVGEAVALLRDSADRLDRRAREMAQSGHGILHRLAAASAEALALGSFSEALHDGAAVVLACATGPLPPPRDWPAATSALLATAWQRYTMDAERQVHEDLVGRPMAAAEDALPTTPQVDLDELLF